MPKPPKTILYIRPDTFGDLVLFASALKQLELALPETKHVLVVRAGYDSLAKLFPGNILWRTTEINPFRQKPADCTQQLDALLADLAPLSPDVIVAGTQNRTWLEVAIAARFPQSRHIALGDASVDPLFATALRLSHGIDAASVFEETVTIDPKVRDWDNNHRLVNHLAGNDLPALAPQLEIPTELKKTAAALIAEKNLPDLGWAAIFPGGMANVPIKAWPQQRFAELIIELRKNHSLPSLLLGHISEQPILESIAQAVAKLGGPAPAIWVGRDGEIALLAALLQTARIYVGHDTGAMHIAAALNRPVVGIFGGGHWPRFQPIGHQTAAVVQPLPCFNCNWDCFLGDAPCVKTLPLSSVTEAVSRLIAAGNEPAEIVVEAHNLSADIHQLIATVTPRFKSLQSDRLARQHKIEELKREADIKDSEIAAIKTEAEARKTEMESIKAELEAECATKDTEIDSLKAEANTKDTEITSLKSETNTKDSEIESLKAEANTKDAEIASLKSETNTKDSEIDQLKATNNEREALIFKLDGHVKDFQALMAQRDINDAAREARLAGLEKTLASLPPDATQWSAKFHDKDVHIANIEHLLRAREAEANSLRTSVENYQAGHVVLEQTKYFSKLLAEKEAAIQTLHRACVEREKVIRQLAVNSTGFTAGLGKLWDATCAHWRLKIAVPFSDWLFKKVVEDYWMQIGVLRHYDPRPIKWDKLPKRGLPPEKLPQIGIVTPSYGQATFVETTMLSVLNQKYPKVRYVVQDGGSKDASPQIIARYADRLHHWESARDKGQADAVRKGFTHLEPALGPDDVMAWLNSDDLIAPHVLRYVGEYFARHPEVDAIYGHRIIIDGHDQDVGRWIMPPHDNKTLEWIDYVPQETLFWRKRLWDRVGGIDTSFQFALDWDLLARFQQAGAKIVRLPYHLGCFRVHAEQKTSQHIHTIGNEEMIRVRSRFHGDRHSDHETINRYARKARFTGALIARLAALGIRF